MSTFFAKQEEQKPRWFVVDADGKVLGKVAVKVANLLRGKTKSTFTPHVDTGDFVVVVNAAKVVLTGRKELQKKYMTYTGFTGTEKIRSAKAIRAGRNPGRLLELAVRGMIPHNRLGRQVITKLKIYPGPTHPHAAQQPEAISL
jgi:large subunit ribosomal protein L13